MDWKNFTKDIGKWFLGFLADMAGLRIADKLSHEIKDHGEHKGEEKSKTTDKATTKLMHGDFAGIGTDDEALALNGLIHAAFEMGAEDAGIDRLMKVLSEYPLSKRRRFITIAGKRELELLIDADGKRPIGGYTEKEYNSSNKIIRTTTKFEKNKVVFVDPCGNGILGERIQQVVDNNGHVVALRVNVDGARLFCYLSTKSEEQIRNILEGMKLTDTPADAISEIYENLVTSINRVEKDTEIFSTIDAVAGNLLAALKDEEDNKKESWLFKKLYKY